MKKINIARTLSGLAMAAVLFAGTFMNVDAATGTVAVDSAKVRADASTTADTVAAAAKGSTVQLGEQKTDASGNVWYQVTLSDGKSGYIRSDLMTITEDAAPAADEGADDAAIAAIEGTDTAPAPVGNAAGVDVNAIAVPEGVTPSDLQNANIAVPTGKVRSDASTNDSIVATLADGTAVVVAGSKTGSDSKTWYFISFVDGGSQQYGYVRSDLLKLGDIIVIEAPVEEAPEEVVAEEPVEAEAPVNNDYELVYTDDGTGNEVWYLYNHIDNTRQKLQELLDFAANQQKVQEEHDAQMKTFRIIVIALASLLIIAIAVIIIILIRNRGNDYYDDEEYEDEEEEEEEEEEEIEVRSSKRRFGRRRSKYDYDEEDEEEEEEEEEERPMQNAAKRRAAQGNAPRRPVTYSEDDDASAAAVRRNSDRKPKNFMLDDDDFEFEFLNMDDK